MNQRFAPSTAPLRAVRDLQAFSGFGAPLRVSTALKLLAPVFHRKKTLFGNLIIVLILALPLIVTGFAMRKVNPILAATFGLLTILIMQVAFHWVNETSHQACLQSACELEGLPVDCGVRDFGCDEGNGLNQAGRIFMGIAQLIIYFIGLIVILYIYFHRLSTAGTARPPADDQTVH